MIAVKVYYYIDYYCGWISIIGVLTTSFIILSILINEIIIRIGFRIADLTRDYIFGANYKLNLIIVLVYFCLLSFGYTVFII